MRRHGDPHVTLVIQWRQVHSLEEFNRVEKGLVRQGWFSRPTGVRVTLRDNYRGTGYGAAAKRFAGQFNPERVSDAKEIAVLVVHEALFHGLQPWYQFWSIHYHVLGFVDASHGGQVGLVLSDEAARFILGKLGIQRPQH